MNYLKDYNFREIVYFRNIYMEEIKEKKNKAYIFGLISGILAIITCLVTIGFSVTNSYIAIYTLATSLVFLGINYICLHLSSFRQNILINIVLTALTFVIAILVSLTKYGIYFLITANFLYALAIIITRVLAIIKNHSTQSIVFNILSMVFLFTASFVFFFPEIYAKHATSVSNSNFIIMCFTVTIIVASSKNIISPYYHALKLNMISNIIKKSLVYEIILSLMILVILCSVYFTLVEPSMTSFVDSLWYSFSVITTIGFGDVCVTTTFGRILSVILGISGIVVVALFTSLIVNFYNEMNKRREEKEMNKILEKVEKIEEIEEEKK